MIDDHNACIRGTAVIEIVDLADMQDLKKPAHLAIGSVVNSRLLHNSDLLVERVKRLLWLDGSPSVWAACKFASMRRLRRLRDDCRGDHGLDSANLDFSSD
ncbi:MAG: SIP domain-containing protein [Hoeflea sp.]|uniref:SIP domain-containing protein n=1 Tax=Hoeflea sp. TaxID=1940281 RepID=UPI003EF601F7